MTKKAMTSIDYVRPPELRFTEIKKTKQYIEYEIETFKDAKEKASNDPFLKDIDSLIYCNDKLRIKVPSKSYMKKISLIFFLVALSTNPAISKIYEYKKRNLRIKSSLIFILLSNFHHKYLEVLVFSKTMLVK